VKTDARRIGQYGRLPVWRFKYRGHDQEHVGFMADEVMQVDPGAIVFLDGGIMAVDYDKEMEAA